MRKVVLSLIVFISMIFVGSVKAEETYDSYNIGDQVEVKGEKYHVIADSEVNQSYVTLLKDDYIGNQGKYGDTATFDGSNAQSAISIWIQTNFGEEDLIEDGGSKFRLLNGEDLEKLKFEYKLIDSEYVYSKTEETPDWVMAGDADYWTMITLENSTDMVFAIGPDSGYSTSTDNLNIYIRPVINASKSIVTKINSVEEELDSDVTSDIEDDTTKESVKVEDTLLQKSLVGTIIGLILIGLGITGYLIGLKLSYKKSR